MGDSKTSLSNSKTTQHNKLEREWRSFQKEMWNPFIDRVDVDLETLNGRSNHHRELLDNNLKWQRQAEELAGRHEQRISELEKNLEEKEVYISNIECMLADLSGCYIQIRPDPDVLREETKTESGGQLLTAHTRTRAGETRSRPEETKTAGAKPEFLSVPKEPQRETRRDK